MTCWKPSTSTLTRSSRTSRPPDARRRASGGRTTTGARCEHSHPRRPRPPRTARIIAEHAGAAAFFAPEVAFEDALSYLPALLEKRGIAAEPALAVLERLAGIVHTVGAETYSPLRRTALARIEQRDPDDWPILATAIVLQCPIWTEDRDFFGTGLPTWTTDRVEIYLAADE